MCELLDRVEERGIAIGEKRGIAIGEKRGIAIGEERGIALGEKRGMALGEQQGILIGDKRRQRETALNLRRYISDMPTIAEVVGASEAQVREWLDEA